MSDPQPLSEAEEAELRKAVEGMTPGPWRQRYNGLPIYRGPLQITNTTSEDLRGWVCASQKDAAGIVALRNNAERLLATIANLRQHVNTLTIPSAKATAPQDDLSRCAICGWPLAATISEGCVRGNCSMRPFPKAEQYYSPTRATQERSKGFGKPTVNRPAGTEDEG